MSPAHLLAKGLQALALDFPSALQTTLLNYLGLLEKWNHVYNLTAIDQVAEMIPKHVLDSLAVLPYIEGDYLLDVGTGAGVPGLLLAICCPHWQWVLLDRRPKKVRFVNQAILELGIKNAKVMCVQSEKFSSNRLFNTIISRAYGSLSLFYQHTQQVCAPHGCWLAMKGTYPQQELLDVSNLPVKIKVLPLQVPFLSAPRHLVVMRNLR